MDRDMHTNAHPAIRIEHGIPETQRSAATELYEQAFGPKFAVAIPGQASRLRVITAGLMLDHAWAAFDAERLVGLAGYRSKEGSLTGGIDWRGLKRELGLWGAVRAALVFELYERAAKPGEMTMDGIVVDKDHRGQGIGATLLERLADHARETGYRQLRLDVIDTNPGAKKLYLRQQFCVTETQQFGYLRWLLGFGGASTMVREL